MDSYKEKNEKKLNTLRKATDAALLFGGPKVKAAANAVKNLSKDGLKGLPNVGINKKSGLLGMTKRFINNRTNNLNQNSKNNSQDDKSVDTNPFSLKNMFNFFGKNGSSSETDFKEAVSDNFGFNIKIPMRVGIIATIVSVPIIFLFVFTIVFMTTNIFEKLNLFKNGVESATLKDFEDIDEDKLEEIESKYINTTFNIENDTSSLKMVANKTSDEYIEEMIKYYSSESSFSTKTELKKINKFFLKIYYIQEYYKKNYSVQIDIPLLLSTLSNKTGDIGEMFSLNVNNWLDSILKTNNPKYSYDYDWSNYYISEDDSSHDIEILTQHMVSKKIKEYCVDSSGNETNSNITTDFKQGEFSCQENEDYKSSDMGYQIDEEKYREFLKEYLEKKYYLGNLSTNSENNENNISTQGGSYTSWTQCNQSWSSYIVPYTNSTLCQIGCAITSTSIIVAKSGTEVIDPNFNPGIAMKKYFSFSAGGNLDWTSVSKLAPNFHYVNSINVEGMKEPEKISLITKYSSEGYYMIFGVGKKTYNHFVAFDYMSGNTVHILDPGPSRVTDLFSTYKLYAIKLFKKD